MNYATQEKSIVAMSRQQMYENIIGEGEDNVDLVVRRLITSLGFKSKLLGTKYLEDAILYRYANANIMFAGMTNSAYIAVADIWCSTANRVERAIRNSIINCYTHGALKSFNDLAQAPVINAEFAPSNGEFMSSVVNWLQLEKQSGRIK
ncbi:MAG: hypothetical protein J1F68_02590 [Clostridiales bacterium]|nr:hypothetical protein [Clostridiales bacterium]